MARIEDLNFVVRIKNIRQIKKATRAIEKLSKTVDKFNIGIEKAIVSVRQFSDALPLICEIEEGKQK